jgi:hypothetical protein
VNAGEISPPGAVTRRHEATYGDGALLLVLDQDAARSFVIESVRLLRIDVVSHPSVADVTGLEPEKKRPKSLESENSDS